MEVGSFIFKKFKNWNAEEPSSQFPVVKAAALLSDFDTMVKQRGPVIVFSSFFFLFNTLICTNAFRHGSLSLLNPLTRGIDLRFRQKKPPPASTVEDATARCATTTAARPGAPSATSTRSSGCRSATRSRDGTCSVIRSTSRRTTCLLYTSPSPRDA